jgi:hypothetical protein
MVKMLVLCSTSSEYDVVPTCIGSTARRLSHFQQHRHQNLTRLILWTCKIVTNIVISIVTLVERLNRWCLPCIFRQQNQGRWLHKEEAGMILGPHLGLKGHISD